ncbi:unnamed protein product [Albugo candida]|uniref:Glucose-methanol-choline oxidoreductase N-terminal domain-containing protein n=1 Tax=Albugo candida TaxID=65357 RepID=A0A024GSX0_9STRA|nr:unnamed protein product [Albugo candida]|eukprot:CCI49419.1 unnamed protein product [Albugo candida]
MTSTIEFQGRRTTGVHVKYNRTHCQTKFRANKEIILSGGAINTPQLLLLLGVGDADNLKQINGQPESQYHFLPEALTGQLIPGNVHALRATSRGNSKLQSAGSRAHPILDPNYLDTLQAPTYSSCCSTNSRDIRAEGLRRIPWELYFTKHECSI